jgi:hypothetical protein
MVEGNDRRRAAWRTRGHAFAAARPIPSVRAVTEPTLVVDPAGTVYLSPVSSPSAVAARARC